MQPTPERFRALARSSPWRWETLRFRMYGHEGVDAAVRAWLRRPDRLRVESLAGKLLAVETTRSVTSVAGVYSAPAGEGCPVPEHEPDDSPLLGPDGLVLRRPWPRERAEDPMYENYRWVAMLDPVEFADTNAENAASPPVLVDAVHEVDHHGRPAWEALLRPTASYDPCCECCPLLPSAESDAYSVEQGLRTVRDVEPDFRYADAHRVRLDVGTGVCVLTEEVGGSHAGQGHEVFLEAVDEPMADELFRRPARSWFRR